MDFDLDEMLKKRITDSITSGLKNFEDYLDGVDIIKDVSWDGEPCLTITIHVREDLDVDAFSKKSLGLGIRVRKAMGEEYADVFPYFRLKSYAVEKATA